MASLKNLPNRKAEPKKSTRVLVPGPKSGCSSFSGNACTKESKNKKKQSKVKKELQAETKIQKEDTKKLPAAEHYNKKKRKGIHSSTTSVTKWLRSGSAYNSPHQRRAGSRL
jgi:hypothetical protein